MSRSPKRKPKGRGNHRVKRQVTSRPRTPMRVLWTIAKWGTLIALVGAAVGATVIALLFWNYGRDPRLRVASIKDFQPKQVSRVLAKDGTVVGEIFDERRTFVSYDKIPKFVVDAVVSAEDARFWQHEGLDYLGMVRALLANVMAGRTKQGASTITQQVVKNVFLSNERTFKRKVKEIVLTRRIERELSKEEIMVLYLNQIYFGHNRYGVQEAARFYFGKDVGDVNLGEAALLGGLPQGPENISPKKPANKKRAKLRQTYVLERMAANGYISTEDARKWIDRPIRVVDGKSDSERGKAPEWVSLGRKYLEAELGEKLDKVGARVTTSLDMRTQTLATRALRRGLQAVDKRQKYGRAHRKVSVDTIPLAVAKLARKRGKSGIQPGKRYEAVVTEVHDKPGHLLVDLGKYIATCSLPEKRYNPDGKSASNLFAVGDVVRVVMGTKTPQESDKTREALPSVELAPGPQGAVVIVDVMTREVTAMIGGYQLRTGDFNRAMMAKRQPGSSFKPFVYAAAIDSGDFTPATIVNDAPEVYDLWKPQNYKRGAFLGPIRLRQALAKSINTVAIRVMHDIGPERVSGLAQGMGVTSTLPKTLSLALGSGEVTPLELTNAFATFAAGGVFLPPKMIISVNDEKLPEASPQTALRPEVAYIVVNMMRSVVTEGTATKAASLSVPVVGKTGTSNQSRDAWFVGLTSRYAVGVWVGFDDHSPLGRGESGGKTALPIFVEIIKGMKNAGGTFVQPAGVEVATIDKKTGLLAPDTAKPGDSYSEVFIAGSVPKDTAPAPGEVDVESFVLGQYDDDEDELGQPVPPNPTEKAAPKQESPTETPAPPPPTKKHAPASAPPPPTKKRAPASAPSPPTKTPAPAPVPPPTP